MVGGWESAQQARLDQTASYLSDPPSVCVCVCMCPTVCPPIPKPDNREGPVPDWGQLVAAEGWRRRRW